MYMITCILMHLFYVCLEGGLLLIILMYMHHLGIFRCLQTFNNVEGIVKDKSCLVFCIMNCIRQLIMKPKKIRKRVCWYNCEHGKGAQREHLEPPTKKTFPMPTIVPTNMFLQFLWLHN